MTRAERIARDMARAAAEVIGDTNKLSSFRVTKFGRHRDGYFHARITVNSETFYVHCRWGSWMVPTTVGETRSGQRELLSPFRDVLCERMRAFERVENQRRAEAEKEAKNGRKGSSATVVDGGLPEGGDPDGAPDTVPDDTRVGV